MIKACIFDLDGVIVNTAKYHYLAWRQLVNEMGFDFTEADNERLKGVSRMRSLDILLEIGKKEISQIEKIELANKKNKWYVEYILKLEPEEILPGVKEFLNDLQTKKIKIVLGSSSKNAKLILDGLKLTNYFDAIIDGTKVSNAKPDPEVFLLGAKALGLEPQDCLVFEDAQAGIEAAKNGGMLCIGIGEEENLRGADFVMPGFVGVNIDDLISILNSNN